MLILAPLVTLITDGYDIPGYSPDQAGLCHPCLATLGVLQCLAEGAPTWATHKQSSTMQATP